MRFVLEIKKGPDAARTLALEPGERRLIGRASHAHMRIESDEYISDLHVAIEVDRYGQCRAQDLCSSNGTRVNGAVIEGAFLAAGDTLRVGETELHVTIDETLGQPRLGELPPLPEVPGPLRDKELDKHLHPDDKDAFIRRALTLVRRDYARELAAWDPGDEGLRAAIEAAIARAESYGVVREDDIVRYIKLMAILGPRFDEDATLPWAGGILRKKIMGMPRRLDALKEIIAARYGKML